MALFGDVGSPRLSRSPATPVLKSQRPGLMPLRESLSSVESPHLHTRFSSPLKSSSMSPSHAGDSIYRMIEEITEDEYHAVVDESMHRQVTLDDVNEVVAAINEVLADKQFGSLTLSLSGSKFGVHEIEECSSLGPRCKMALILLMRLKRVRVAADATVDGTKIYEVI